MDTAVRTDVQSAVMETQLKPLTELVPADYNPRAELTPDDREFQQLAASIERFGVVDPLVWNKRTGRLVGGHQRLAVLKHLGHDAAPVVEVDLDEDEERALNIALNKIEGRWDNQQLLSILDSLQKSDFDLFAVGFDDEQFDDLLRRIDQDESTDFLSDLMDADQDLKDEGAEIDPADHTPDEFGDAWYSMSFSVTSEERQVILKMLRLAQKIYGIETSPKALVRIAEVFLEEHANDPAAPDDDGVNDVDEDQEDVA